MRVWEHPQLIWEDGYSQYLEEAGISFFFFSFFPFSPIAVLPYPLSSTSPLTSSASLLLAPLQSEVKVVGEITAIRKYISFPSWFTLGLGRN